ncbi:class E sortase [Streptomyces mangrovisoli]|uniref:Class E sortase n=1 Tax=Streptomyces mangrovisoli TaxID=1428628 RepID=A0A1J4NS58_9ACTN|nr:class E sortase [Streptomyces mangrovisoli]OIJ65231.1 class E sortase [Streptomyces mangrovisoli]
MRVPVVRNSDRRRRALRRRVLWSGGELLVTAGVLLMLLVLHELWWTNLEAKAGAARKADALEREWGDGAGAGAGGGSTASGGDGSTGNTGASGSGGTSSSGAKATGSGSGAGSARPARSQAYAVIVIPALGLRAPVAEGVGKHDVLDKGYVGHYPGTQQPGEKGNFAVAGHRNTHGEPFRYLNRLRVADVVKIETASATYTYTVDQILPRTSAHDSGVIRSVPRSTVHPKYGYSAPGRYLTLTTCTPEFTSRYRLVVWGTLTSTRPR